MSQRPILLGVLGLLLAQGAPAADYYVAPGGSDGADGLAPGSAWESLVHAASQVGPGDTVHVADGDYTGFHLTTSGAAGAPIAFVAQGDNARIAEDNPVTPDGINLEGVSHVVIDGFVVDGRTRAGVRAVQGAFVTVRNVRAGANGRWGIFTGFVDDLLVEDNECHDSIDEHGIYVSNSADRPVVRGNHLHGNHANGLHMNGDASLGGDGLIEDALVERNVIHGNGAGGGSGINIDGPVRAVIRNNLLYDNHASGISLYRIDAGGAPRDNVVVHNTIVNAPDGRWCVNVRDGASNTTIRNNVLWNEHAFRGALTIAADSLTGLDSDHNVGIGRFTTDDGNSVLDLAGWQALGHDANSVEAVPAELFLAPGADFRLRPDAPAVDAGDPAVGLESDLDGAPRPVGTAPDAGAYEAQLLSCGNGVLDPGEACESDADCASEESCVGCACVLPPLCAAGATIEKGRLQLRADGRFRVSGRSVLGTTPDPSADGLRIVFEGPGGPLFDVTAVGAAWQPKGKPGRWRYASETGPVTRAKLRDLSKKTPGLTKWSVRGTLPSAALPAASDGLETTVLLGSECAELAWNSSEASRPHCRLAGDRVKCR